MKQDAKDRLLRSAIDVFAYEGYRGGKIADIVRGAGANIAAVNYHFGSKDQLFVAALRRAFEDAEAVYPIRGALAYDAAAKDKVSAIAHAILMRSFDEGSAGHFNRMMSNTINTPGSPVAMILTEVEEFELKYLSEVLADFLGTDSDEVVGWGVGIFISMATMISKCPVGTKDHLFKKKPTQRQITSLVDGQIEAIFAALEVIPKSVPC